MAPPSRKYVSVTIVSHYAENATQLMIRFVPLLVVFSLIFSACSNLVNAGKADAVFPGAHDFGATVISFSPDSHVLVSGGHKGNVRFWDVEKKMALADIPAHEGVVRALQFLSNTAFASGAEDGKLILWSGTTIRATRQLTSITSLTRINGHLVSGHADGWLRIWDENLNERVSLKLDQAIVALSSHGNQLAIGTDDQILIMNDTLNTIRSLKTDGGTPHDLQFSPDGKSLAAGNWFKLSTWDVSSGMQALHATEHNGLLTSVSFSPDGKYIASLGRHTDSAIRISDTQHFLVERRYQAHELCGAMIRYSPNGRWMASASDDESVRIYDLNKLYSLEQTPLVKQ
jgi:WD40 repeat protein